MVLFSRCLVLHEIIDKLFSNQGALYIEMSAHCPLYFYNAVYYIPICNSKKNC